MIKKKEEYDQYGLPVKFIDQETGTAGIIALELDLEFDALRGNLTSRHNKAFTGEENFAYDNLDRLTQITGAITHTKSYDPFGRIQNNSAVGTYSYQSSSRYKLNEIVLNTDGDNYYEEHALQQITYNTFKKPVDILEENKGHVSFEYGPMMNRTVAYYGGLDADKDDLRYKKTYSSIIPVEIVNDSDDNSSKFITYIGGDAYSAPIAHIKKGSIDEYHYLHRDYLGSILAITDSNANIVEQTHFGAWGKVEQFSASATGATTFNYETSLLGRGYTGHEHFVSVGLIHMNGRMYDANLGRFLSPDNYIQDPYNSQSFNRFGYVWNNPLKYADQSGELIGLIIGAIVGAYIGGTLANDGELNPFAWKWDGDTWKGVIIGAIIGAIVGESVSALITGGGAKAFGVFAPKIGIGTPLGSIAISGNDLGTLDFSWTTVAGGSGTIEDVIKLPGPDVAQIPLVQGPRVNVYVEGDYDDWVITADEYKYLYITGTRNPPYKVGQTFKYSGIGMDDTVAGWSSFFNRGTPGGADVIAGNFNLTATVNYDSVNSNYFLQVFGSVGTRNHPGNSYNGFLNIGYSASNSEQSLPFGYGIPQIFPTGVTHLGGQSFQLPWNPNELSFLNVTLSAHRRTPIKAIGAGFRVNLLNDIRN